MSHLVIEGIPAHTRAGALFRWILDFGKIKKDQIGKIEILNRSARISIDESLGKRLSKELHSAGFANTKVDVWYRNDTVVRPCDGYFKKLNYLLELETKASREIAKKNLEEASTKQLHHSSSSLVNLIISETDFTIGGRIIVTLTAQHPQQYLPYTRLRVGSPIILSSLNNSNNQHYGIVSSIRRQLIEVTLNRFIPSEDDTSKYRVDLSDDEIGRQREENALARVRNADNGRLAELRDIILGNAGFSFTPQENVLILDQALNDVQQDAVYFALSANDIGIIHGPPGTGKTTVITEIIRQAGRRGQKVLACAPSNLAVDNIFEKLLESGEKVVRLGNPARVSPRLRQFSLDGMIADHRDLRHARKLLHESDGIIKRLQKQGRGFIHHEDRRQMLTEARELKEQAHQIEGDALATILESATVICSTLHGVETGILGPRTFELLVIDEACQATEPATWIPIVRSQKVILAGDHYQLPPTVVSPIAEQQGLNISLLEKLMGKNASTISRKLAIQYRMNRDIATFSSNEFYDSSLVADTTVANRLLTDFGGVTKDELTESAIKFIDTSGADFNEEHESGGTSIRNPKEADLVCRKIEMLIEYGVPPQQITVLSPYTAQVRLLKESIGHNQVEISSIDGFQGRENDVVIVSLVRSNIRKEVGFLADVRRMNVALTRARRKLIVIGESATISGHPFYERLLEYFDSIGAYFGVWDEDY